MMKISHAAVPCLSLLISAQFIWAPELKQKSTEHITNI